MLVLLRVSIVIQSTRCVRGAEGALGVEVQNREPKITKRLLQG